MAYFGALLARADDGWAAYEADIDEVEDLAGILELMREHAVDESTVLLLLEQEDRWFGVVRLDGEDDPRIFVSDAAAVSRSAYGDVLLAATPPLSSSLGEQPAVLEVDAGEGGDAGTSTLAELVEDDEVHPAGPAGDAELLDDLGMTGDALISLCEHAAAPSDALASLASALGADDELEAVR